MKTSGIILQPVVSEKSFTQSEDGVYTFRVHEKANKKEVASEVAARFKVTVEKVNIVNRRSKRVMDMRKGISGRRRGYKKAIVTLKSGDTIEIFK